MAEPRLKGVGEETGRGSRGSRCWPVLETFDPGRKEEARTVTGLAGPRGKMFYSYLKKTRADPVGRWEKGAQGAGENEEALRRHQLLELCPG